MTLKHHGSGLADLENAVEYNNFFTVKVQRWTEKILIMLQLWIKLYAIIAKYVPENINIISQGYFGFLRTG